MIILRGVLLRSSSTEFGIHYTVFIGCSDRGRSVYSRLSRLLVMSRRLPTELNKK